MAMNLVLEWEGQYEDKFNKGLINKRLLDCLTWRGNISNLPKDKEAKWKW